MSFIGPAIRFARTFTPVVRRLNKIGERSDPGMQFIDRYFPPHLRAPARRFYKYSQIASAGGVIYDLIQESFNGFSPKSQPSRYQKQQKYRPSSGYNRSGRNRYSNYRDRRRFCRPRYNKSSYQRM